MSERTISSRLNSTIGTGNMCFLAKCVILVRPSPSFKSVCCTSPFNTIVEPSPTRVSNILSSCVVMFCASSQIIKASSKERPLMRAKGAISMLPFLIPVSTAPFPKCLTSTSRTGNAQGATFSPRSPGRIPISLPTEIMGRVITILSILGLGFCRAI